MPNSSPWSGFILELLFLMEKFQICNREDRKFCCQTPEPTISTEGAYLPRSVIVLIDCVDVIDVHDDVHDDVEDEVEDEVET